MTTTTQRQALTLESGKTYRTQFRGGVSGLASGDWTADGRGEYRPWLACEWQCTHGGVHVSRYAGDGQPNVDHGTVVVTLRDGTRLTGTYQAGDQWMSVTID